MDDVGIYTLKSEIWYYTESKISYGTELRLQILRTIAAAVVAPCALQRAFYTLADEYEGYRVAAEQTTGDAVTQS